MLTRRLETVRFLGGQLVRVRLLRGRVITFAAVFAAAFAFSAAPAFGQADSTQTESISTEFDASFRVLPSPIWSRTSGFAAGVGYDLRNALMPHDRFLITAKPGVHLGRYTSTYFAGDPDRHPLYGLVSAYYEAAGREWYYGLGPATSIDDQIALEKQMVDVELRIGLQMLGRRVFVQPAASYFRHDAEDFDNWDGGAIVRLGADSRANLLTAVLDPVQSGSSFGIAAGIDLRDRFQRTRRGLLLQGSARRYRFEDAAAPDFDRYGLGAYAFLPVGQNQLALRAVTELTRGADAREIPFYFLPRLDADLLPGYALNRFFGRDLLALTLEYSMPLFQFFEFAALDALLSVGAGSVYDDISEEFEASIVFDAPDRDPADTYPLRPSVGLGFEVESFTSDHWDMRVLLGWSPEGIRLIKFGFIHDVRDIRLNNR